MAVIRANAQSIQNNERSRRVNKWNWGAFLGAVTSSSPAHYNRLNELSGTVAVDQMGNFNGSYTDVVFGGMSLVPSDLSAKSVATSSGQYISIPSVGTISGAFALMFAFRGAANVYPFFRDNTAAGGTGTYITVSGGFLGVGVAGNVSVTSTAESVVTDGSPHLIMLVRDGSNVMNLYIDNATSVWSGTKAGNVLFSTLYVARNGTNTVSQTRPGMFAEVAVWTSAPSSENISAIFQAWVG